MIEIRGSATVPAPMDRVWSLLRNFGNLSYFPAAEGVELLDHAPPTTVGAFRRITLAGGGSGLEQLLGLSDLHHRLEYRYIDDPELPFRNYVAEVSLTEITLDGTTLVDWRARYDVDAEHADSIRNFIEFGIIGECLSGLRRLFE